MNRKGVATSDRRVFDGFAAVSAPIRYHAGSLAATMTLIGLRSHVPLDGIVPIVDNLKRHATGSAPPWGAMSSRPQSSLQGPTRNSTQSPRPAQKAESLIDRRRVAAGVSTDSPSFRNDRP